MLRGGQGVSGTEISCALKQTFSGGNSPAQYTGLHRGTKFPSYPASRGKTSCLLAKYADHRLWGIHAQAGGGVADPKEQSHSAPTIHLAAPRRAGAPTLEATWVAI